MRYSICLETDMMKKITDETGTFLAEYASLLWGSGATCTRIEKNIGRMAHALNLDADIEIMPGHVQVVLPDGSVIVRKTRKCGISFDINAKLSRLSWELADGKIGFIEAQRMFRHIARTRPTNAREVLVLTSLANASFCRLFGGDIVAMLIAFVATLAGYRLKQVMLDDGRDVRLTFLCSAFFSATISAGGHVFGWGTTPEIALGTSVLYLIPGVPYINAISDIIGRHYLCALSRFMDACVLTCCLSAGLCIGMFILGLNWF
ncbi:threonine/serine exporter ThrE family protein [Muribaculum intestinale]|uniref:threonine/serine ThrE exporter family protein n=2 Tax=Muribaculum intestinale TaxID=1796646 RepID=UPI0025B2B9D3|nr:threonine/serine exporter family protein [Muribaculum intestinale]